MKILITLTVSSQEQCLRLCRSIGGKIMIERLLSKIFRRKKSTADQSEDDFDKSFADAETSRRIYKEETTSVILGTLLNNHALGSSIAHQSKKIK